MRLYLVHTKHVMKSATNQYGAYIVAGETAAQAQEKVENSNLFQPNNKPLDWEYVMRTETLDVDSDDPLVAFIHYGNRTLDMSTV